MVKDSRVILVDQNIPFANKLFDSLGDVRYVNGREVTEKFENLEEAIDAGFVVGIDFPFSLLGLINHVIFVYGYDENNLYVFDTHQVLGLEYEKITDDNRYIMKIPKNIIEKRWTRFGRVWVMKKIF